MLNGGRRQVRHQGDRRRPQFLARLFGGLFLEPDVLDGASGQHPTVPARNYVSALAEQDPAHRAGR
jgi:hypothetical protein